MLHKMAVLSSDGRGCHAGLGLGSGETRPYFLQCGAAGGSSVGRGGLSGSESGLETEVAGWWGEMMGRCRQGFQILVRLSVYLGQSQDRHT